MSRDYYILKTVQSYSSILEECGTVPELYDVYDDIFLDIIDDVETDVEEVFGVGAIITNNVLDTLNIEIDGSMPSIGDVASILNAFGLGYLINGILYNLFQSKLLEDEQIVEG